MKPTLGTWQTILVGLAVLSCMIVITLLIFIGLNLLSNNSEPEEAGRICVFTKTEVWCVYSQEYNND